MNHPTRLETDKPVSVPAISRFVSIPMRDGCWSAATCSFNVRPLKGSSAHDPLQIQFSPTRLETVEELPEAAQTLNRVRQPHEPVNPHASWQQQCNSLSFV